MFIQKNISWILNFSVKEWLFAIFLIIILSAILLSVVILNVMAPIHSASFYLSSQTLFPIKINIEFWTFSVKENEPQRRQSLPRLRRPRQRRRR